METSLVSCDSFMQELLQANRQWDQATQDQLEQLWDSKSVLAHQLRTLQDAIRDCDVFIGVSTRQRRSKRSLCFLRGRMSLINNLI